MIHFARTNRCKQIHIDITQQIGIVLRKKILPKERLR